MGTDMLKGYVEGFNPDSFVKDYMNREHIPRNKAMSVLRNKIPKENYYQDKLKKAIKKRYPSAFVRKIAQGPYSEGGTPDLMVIVDGHYFGFEVKRPVVGTPSPLQLAAIEQIQKAGGTAALVTWPEEAFCAIDDYFAESGGVPSDLEDDQPEPMTMETDAIIADFARWKPANKKSSPK